jgi:hypothetical protein
VTAELHLTEKSQEFANCRIKSLQINGQMLDLGWQLMPQSVLNLAAVPLVRHPWQQG